MCVNENSRFGRGSVVWGELFPRACVLFTYELQWRCVRAWLSHGPVSCQSCAWLVFIGRISARSTHAHIKRDMQLKFQYTYNDTSTIYIICTLTLYYYYFEYFDMSSINKHTLQVTTAAQVRKVCYNVIHNIYNSI